MMFAIASAILCFASSTQADLPESSYPELEGKWISELGAEYEISEGQMVCRKIPDQLKPKFTPWVGKTRVKDVRPGGVQNTYTGLQAKRHPGTAKLLYWIKCELTVSDRLLTISFRDHEVGRAFSYTFRRPETANKPDAGDSE